jgi:hypothetical protein
MTKKEGFGMTKKKRELEWYRGRGRWGFVKIGWRHMLGGGEALRERVRPDGVCFYVWCSKCRWIPARGRNDKKKKGGMRGWCVCVYSCVLRLYLRERIQKTDNFVALCRTLSQFGASCRTLAHFFMSHFF